MVHADLSHTAPDTKLKLPGEQDAEGEEGLKLEVPFNLSVHLRSFHVLVEHSADGLVSLDICGASTAIISDDGCLRAMLLYIALHVCGKR